jgi:subtilisin family serine protease
MFQLCVIVPKLNIRNSPVADPTYSNWVGDVLFGDTVQATDKVNDWYKDDSNRYYWAGGLFDITECQQWMLDLRLPEIWQQATGKGVGVAVVDTGIVPDNADLPYDQNNFFVFDSTVSLVDNQGHGTNCAGLIGAKNKLGQFIGVAPDCNLYICKIANDYNFPDPVKDTQLYANAINWCANKPEIQIISISWGNEIQDTNIISAIQAAIDFAVQQKKIVVCATGDAYSFDDQTPIYPAFCSNTIATGAIPVEDLVYPYINQATTSSLQGSGIISYGIDPDSQNLHGTSQANAIMAGLIALLIQKLNNSYSYNDIKQKISSASKIVNYTINGINRSLPVLDGTLLLNLFKP